MQPTGKHIAAAVELVDSEMFKALMAVDRIGKCAELVAAALAKAEREGMKRAAEIVASYPPDGFFDLLKGATESSDPVYELHLFEGDGGNWAWLMSVLLQPYVSAILSEAGEEA